MNLERITNRLTGVIAQLAEEGKNANSRVRDSVADCLQTDISDAHRLKFYATASIHCHAHGYGDKLPPSGSRDVDPVLAQAYNHINTVITSFVNDGLNNNPDALIMQRPKKNNAGIIMHTQESLIKTMVESAQRWYREQLKNKHWDGSMNTMANIVIPNNNPTTDNNPTTTDEVQE
jgi:hypothetical protein